MARRCLPSPPLLSPSNSMTRLVVSAQTLPCRRIWARLSVAAEDGELLTAQEPYSEPDYGVLSIHHVGILCENLEKSMAFYKDLLGLKVNSARPNNRLPFRGAWLWVGSEMIHLMELPNPDPSTGRPEHGGRDRHICIAVKDVSKLKDIFDKAAFLYVTSDNIMALLLQLELRSQLHAQQIWVASNLCTRPRRKRIGIHTSVLTETPFQVE